MCLGEYRCYCAWGAASRRCMSLGGLWVATTAALLLAKQWTAAGSSRLNG